MHQLRCRSKKSSSREPVRAQRGQTGETLWFAHNHEELGVTRSFLNLAPAHKMHDLQLVSILERCGLPLCARNNLQVQLNGYAISLHSKMLDERSNRYTIRKIALFAIDL